MSIVKLNEEYLAILRNKLRQNLKDPGSFTIPCIIGGLVDEKALIDLGASINVIPYKIFKKLGLREPNATMITLQLVDRLIRHSRGIIEDVLVKVDIIIFLVHFVILDIDEDVEVPLSLVRLFLATSQSLIDVIDEVVYECLQDILYESPEDE